MNNEMIYQKKLLLLRSEMGTAIAHLEYLKTICDQIGSVNTNVRLVAAASNIEAAMIHVEKEIHDGSAK